MSPTKESYDLCITDGLVYLDGRFQQLDIGVKDGKIASLSSPGTLSSALRTISAAGCYVAPGSIDTHVHFRDPGHSERETFFTGSMAAAAGGVTLVLEHPISSPPQHNKAILDHRIEVADPQSLVDYAFYGAAGADHLSDITALSKEGIVAYKTFLQIAPEGREDEFAGLTMPENSDVLKGFREVAKTGLPIAVHCEDNEMINANIKEMRAAHQTTPLCHAESRPPITEVLAVEKILRIAKETGASAEFVHVSTPEAMEAISRAKKEHLPVLLETCPHYLLLDETALEKLGPFAKCNPPLRKRELVEQLWKYINDGSVDFIGSDHAPYLLSEKEASPDDIFKVPAGFPGIDTRFPLIIDCAVKGKLSLERALDLLCVNPAKCFDLYPRKGSLTIGSDADIVIFNTKKHTLHKEDSYSHSKDIAYTYDGWNVNCTLLYTISRGRIVMDHGVVDPDCKGWGKLVKRKVNQL